MWCGLGEAFYLFVLEGNFLAFVLEGGKFLDAGEDVFQDFGAGMGLGEFKGFLMEEVAHGALDAGGVVEIGLGLFHIGDDVEHGIAEIGKRFGAPGTAEATESGEIHFEAEAIGRRSGNAAIDFGKVVDFLHPGSDLVALLVCD